MIEYPIPEDKASFSQIQSISGETFKLKLDFNSTDRKWRFSLLTSSDQPVIQGVALSPDQSPTRKYSLNSLRGGNFWVFAKKKTDRPLGYDNLGFERSYGLFFLTTEEEEKYEL